MVIKSTHCWIYKEPTDTNENTILKIFIFKAAKFENFKTLQLCFCHVLMKQTKRRKNTEENFTEYTKKRGNNSQKIKEKKEL